MELNLESKEGRRRYFLVCLPLHDLSRLFMTVRLLVHAILLVLENLQQGSITQMYIYWEADNPAKLVPLPNAPSQFPKIWSCTKIQRWIGNPTGMNKFTFLFRIYYLLTFTRIMGTSLSLHHQDLWLPCLSDCLMIFRGMLWEFLCWTFSYWSKNC